MKEIKLSINDSSTYLRWVGIGKEDKAEEITRWRIIYDYEIIFVTEGEIVVEEEDVTYVLRPNDIHIMVPGVWHKRHSLGKYKYYNFHFDILKKNEEHYNIDVINTYLFPDETKKNLSLFRNNYYTFKECELPRKLKIKKPENFLFCFKEMARVFFKQDEISNNQGNMLLLYCLTMMVEQMVESKNEAVEIEGVLTKFESFVEDNISRNISVELYAKSLSYSYDYFRKMFRKKYGVPPQKFIENKKMEFAKKNLRTGKYTVKRIAYVLGYESPYYFSSRFKAVIGESPSSFIGREDKDD